MGLTHYCSTRKDGTGFQLGRKTQRKRMKAKLREIKETLRRLRHTPIDEQGRRLGTMMKGYFAYSRCRPTHTFCRPSAITRASSGSEVCGDAASGIG